MQNMHTHATYLHVTSKLISRDVQGKAKKSAWEQAITDTDGNAEKAKEQYVALVEKMKAEYGYDENKAPEAVGGN